MILITSSSELSFVIFFSILLLAFFFFFSFHCKKKKKKKKLKPLGRIVSLLSGVCPCSCYKSACYSGLETHKAG